MVCEPDQIDDLIQKHNLALEKLEETDQNIATDLIPMAEQNFLTLKLELQKEFGYFHGVLQQLSNVACWRPLRKYYDYGASFNYR